jgi:peptidoglycan/xylan/chitin deacetylase (PgdA/CDA1 family)
MSWSQVRSLADAGFEIGGHTVTHPILSRSNPDEASFEIEESKRAIESECGIECRHFAFPNGQPTDFDAETVDLVRRAGFRSSATTIEGFVNPAEGLFQLRRVSIQTTSPWIFRAAALGWRPRLRATRDGVKRWLVSARPVAGASGARAASR